jgi:hypothetical protein
MLQGGRDLSGGSGEGETRENPIFLPDTTHDFRSLVKLLQDFDMYVPPQPSWLVSLMMTTTLASGKTQF